MGPLAFILTNAAICFGAVALSICHGVQPSPTNRPAVAAAAAACCHLLPGCCGRVHHQSRGRGQPRILGGDAQFMPPWPSRGDRDPSFLGQQPPSCPHKADGTRGRAAAATISIGAAASRYTERLIDRGTRLRRYHRTWLHGRLLNQLLADGRSRPPSRSREGGAHAHAHDEEQHEERYAQRPDESVLRSVDLACGQIRLGGERASRSFTG